MGESDQSGGVRHHLVALDSGYGDVSIESEAARPFGVSIGDAGDLSPEDALAAADCCRRRARLPPEGSTPA